MTTLNFNKSHLNMNKTYFFTRHWEKVYQLLPLNLFARPPARSSPNIARNTIFSEFQVVPEHTLHIQRSVRNAPRAQWGYVLLGCVDKPPCSRSSTVWHRAKKKSNLEKLITQKFKSQNWQFMKNQYVTI